MTDIETAAELRHVNRDLQAELKAIKARAAKPPAPIRSQIMLLSATWSV